MSEPLRLLTPDSPPRKRPPALTASRVSAAVLMLGSLGVLCYTTAVVTRDAKDAAAEVRRATEDLRREREQSRQEEALRRQAVNQAAEIFTLREQLRKAKAP